MCVNYKTCSCCGETKIASKEYFCASSRGKYGLGCWCKSCLSLWREANKEKIKTNNKRYRENNREILLEKKKEYYDSNKKQYLLKNKEWRNNNPEKLKLSKQKEYIKNKEAYIKRARDWAKNNPEKAKISNLLSVRKRLATKFNLSEHFTSSDVENLLVEQQGLCYYCSSDISEGYHIEHKTPLSRGGTDTKDNLCLSCKQCNWSKGKKTEEEYYKYVNLCGDYK